METRDKLFTEEQYLKQLKLYNEEILYYEQKHLSGKHIGYDSLFNYRLRSLLVQYSMGQDIDNLKNNYVETLKTMPRFWTDNGFYIEMLWLLSIVGLRRQPYTKFGSTDKRQGSKRLYL